MGHILSHPVTSKHVERHGNEAFRVGLAAMQGYRVTMEDAHLVHFNLSNHPNLSLFAVFDGHSGVGASHYVCTHLVDRINEMKCPTNESELKQTIMQLDQQVGQQETIRTNGTTACILIIQTDQQQENYHCTIANVGDSRCMLVGMDGVIRFVSEDHKPDDPEESRRIRNAGGSVSFGRVDGELAMSRAIGDWNYKQNSMIPQEQQKVIAQPTVSYQTMKRGEYAILCCDGLVERLTNNELVSFVHSRLTSNPKDPASYMCELLEYSLARGSKDNMSVMCILFQPGSEYETGFQFVAGPCVEEDRKFMEAYIADGVKCGLDKDQLLQLGRRATEQRQQAVASGTGAGAGAGAGTEQTSNKSNAIYLGP